jgi:NADH dehydrogenase/NADH:ubiquinone oxidoreductase subunit G
MGSTPAADCLIAVEAQLSAAQAGAAKVVAVGRYYSGMEPAVRVPAADPMQSAGAFLNRDGDLAMLQAAAACLSHGASARDILTTLSGTGHRDLGALRKELAAEVPEVAAISQPSGSRLVKTTLPVDLANVAPDSRSIAFASHMKAMDLDWS